MGRLNLATLFQKRPYFPLSLNIFERGASADHLVRALGGGGGGVWAPEVADSETDSSVASHTGWRMCT